MSDLLEFGIDSDSSDIYSELAEPCFEASAPHTEVSESKFCLQIQFEYQASGPLVQQDYSTKQVLEIVQSWDVVFSSDRSRDRFTGKPVSQTTGLYYEYSRWYDPSIGRFISQDPLSGVLSNPQSLNPYVYVQNSPTVLTDPSGAGAQGLDCPDGLCQGPAITLNICQTGGCNPEICADNPFICGGWEPTPSDESGGGICLCPMPAGDDVGGGSSSPSGPEPGPVTMSDATTPTITEPGQAFSKLNSNQLGDLGESGTLGKLAQLGLNPETEVEYEPRVELPNGQTKIPDFKVTDSEAGFRGIIETKWTLSDTDPRALSQLRTNVEIAKMTGLPLYYDVYSEVGPYFQDLFRLYGVTLL